MDAKRKKYIRLEVDWPNRFRCTPLPFQRGDKVQTPKGNGVVTAVGSTGLHSTVYRVGKKSYWYGFQLRLNCRPAAAKV